jgi:chromosomal replication initiator protein DnaA
MDEESGKTGRRVKLPDLLASKIRGRATEEESRNADEAEAAKDESYNNSRGTRSRPEDPADWKEPDSGKLYIPMLVTTPASPEMTFDTFVSSKMNAFTFELARIVATQGSTRSAYNPLYIYADVGIGKTHLLSSIANAAKDRKCILVNTSDLEVEFERALRLGVRAEFRQWLVSYGVLLLDDIQLCEQREELQREVFSIINHMIRNARSVVISSDVPPTRLEGVEKRLLSRLGGGAIVALHMADKPARERILRRLDPEHFLPDEVVRFFAENVSDSVRRLKAVVSQMLAFGKHGGVQLDLDLANKVLTMTNIPSEPEIQPASPIDVTPSVDEEKVIRFKKMLAGAQTEAEQVLAIEIAIGERLRQLRNERGDPDTIYKLEKALELLRENRLQEAIQLMGI